MRHRREGFTLVEMLVVIGIIVILVSLLVPMLGAARRSAHMAACMSNQRQIMGAIRAFANDNNEVCPGCAGGPAPLGGIPIAGPGTTPYITIGQAIACLDMLDQATIEKTARSILVARHYVADGSVFHCPERDANPYIAGTRQPAAIYHYVFNNLFVGDMTCDQITGLPTYSSAEITYAGGLTPVGLNRPQNPAGCVMITEDAVVDGQRWVDYDRVTTPAAATSGTQPLDRIHATPVHIYRGTRVTDAYPNILYSNVICTYVDGHTESVAVSTTTVASDPDAFTIPTDSAGIH